jgi:hypothetical protein
MTKSSDASKAGGSGVAAATKVDPSGAPVQVVPDVDLDHPAVDNDPRANTTAEQNRIDFNDPTISGREAVERNLAAAKKKAD